jgi:hypothetical protein
VTAAALVRYVAAPVVLFVAATVLGLTAVGPLTAPAERTPA